MTLTIRLVVALQIALVSCDGVGPGQTSDRDLVLFEAAVRELQTRFPAGLQVTPVPPQLDPARDLEKDVVGARAIVLRRLRVTQAKEVPNFDCPHENLPYQTTEEMKAAMSGCPAEKLLVASIGLSRKAGAPGYQFFQEPSDYSGREIYYILATVHSIGPNGTFISWRDFVFEFVGGRWRLLKTNVWSSI